MRVAAWMTPDPVTVSPETPVPEAAERMRAGGFRRLPVVEAGELVGIVTDRDLKEAMPSDASSLTVWEIPFLLARLKVREVMSRPVLTAREDEPLEAAAGLLLEEKVGGLPVVDANRRLVGVITVTDVLRAFLRSSEGGRGGPP